MKTDLSDRALERIWTYNVFPLIEEQLWGNRDEIDRWRWTPFVNDSPGAHRIGLRPLLPLSTRLAMTMKPTPADRDPLVLAEYGEGEVELTAAQERTLRRLVARSPHDPSR